MDGLDELRRELDEMLDTVVDVPLIRSTYLYGVDLSNSRLFMRLIGRDLVDVPMTLRQLAKLFGK